jgi:hypothetical protein
MSTLLAHAVGVRLPPEMSWISAAQTCKEFSQRHGGDTDGGNTDAVRQHQGVGMDQRAAGVDNNGPTDCTPCADPPTGVV